MSALIWLCGPSAIGKNTLAQSLGDGDKVALAAFGLDAPPAVHDGKALAHDAAPLCRLLADPQKPVVVKHQYHYGTVVRAAAALAATRTHRLALLWCADEIYYQRWEKKYPKHAAKRQTNKTSRSSHWRNNAWPHVLSLHASLVACGAKATVEIYDVSGDTPIRVKPVCVVQACNCGHVVRSELSAMLLSLPTARS